MESKNNSMQLEMRIKDPAEVIIHVIKHFGLLMCHYTLDRTDYDSPAPT